MSGLSSMIQTNDEIGGQWRVLEKLGEGGCGVVFEVKNLTDNRVYAMKVERTNIKRFDQLLKNEALVLKKLQFSGRVPAFVACERTPTFRLLVMELLGSSLSDLRHRLPKRQFSDGTMLRVGIQALEAIADLHNIYYVHRDIKPSNFALGLPPKHRRIYLLDFGLARSLLDPLSTNKRRLRKGRKSIAFRGTPAYCSPNVHRGLEQGRHDDLWSMLYMCVEMIRGTLPWARMSRDKAFMLKVHLSDEYLLAGCPRQFETLLNYYRSLHYENRPDYVTIRRLFEECISEVGVSDSQPLDWEILSYTADNKTSPYEKIPKISDAQSLSTQQQSSNSSVPLVSLFVSTKRSETLKSVTPQASPVPLKNRQRTTLEYDTGRAGFDAVNSENNYEYAQQHSLRDAALSRRPISKYFSESDHSVLDETQNLHS